MAIDMEKVWNINTSIMCILAMVGFFGQIKAGSEVGILATALLVYILLRTKRLENEAADNR